MSIDSRLKLLGDLNPGDTLSFDSMKLYRRNTMFGKLKSTVIRKMYGEGRIRLRENIIILDQDIALIDPSLKLNIIYKAAIGLELLKNEYYSGDVQISDAVDALLKTLKMYERKLCKKNRDR